jgi:hypothetical protein
MIGDGVGVGTGVGVGIGPGVGVGVAKMGGSVGRMIGDGLGVGVGVAFLACPGGVLFGLGRGVAVDDVAVEECATVSERRAVAPLLAEGLMVRLSTMTTPPRARAIRMNDVRARPARRSTARSSSEGQLNYGAPSPSSI